jgi:hypothetical protein
MQIAKEKRTYLIVKRRNKDKNILKQILNAKKLNSLL